MTKNLMHFIAYMKTGPTALHSGGWRHPDATLHDILSPSRYEDAARTFEAAKLDGMFFADFFGVPDTYGGSPDLFLRVGGQHSYLDPMTVLPIMARVTKNLGLGATVSTSFFNAYHLARSLASIDVLSGGRVAWNVVTSTSNLEAQNAGMDGIPPHDERYERADEVLEACMALWKSWGPDSFIMDKQKGLFVDPSKINYVNYEGRWVRTKGPIATPPSPQGHPVIMQAGSSPKGREFAAKWAEVIFTPQSGIETMRAFYDDMQERIVAAGREPGSCKILPGATVFVAETDAIAQERVEYLDGLSAPEYDLAYASLSVGTDLSKIKHEAEIATSRGNQGAHGMEAALKQRALEKNVGLKEAASEGRRGNIIVGSPTTVADRLQEIFETGVCDGFVLMPSVFPSSHEAFCRSVVPELQRRGLFRTEYSSSTLRGNLLS